MIVRHGQLLLSPRLYTSIRRNHDLAPLHSFCVPPNPMPKSRPGGPKRKKQKWHGVRIGRIPGVYETWEETEAQVKGFPRATHKSFSSRQEAEIYAGTSRTAHTDTHFPTQLDTSQLGLPPKPLQPRSTASHVHPSPKAPTSPQLTLEQTQILHRILSGENTFFTGPAGTGKSVLLRAIVQSFKERQEEVRRSDQIRTEGWVRGVLGGTLDKTRDEGGDGRRRGWNLGVTASTGMAAVNIGGCTIHSWAGVGLGKLPVDKLYESISRNKLTMTRWRETDALIIDEISMLSANLLDTLSALGQKLRSNPSPFGGIQIIASGDFYQLPPVPDTPDPSTSSSLSALFAFESQTWPRLFPPSQTHSLSTVFRQSDRPFISLLTRLRSGSLLTSDISLIRDLDRPVPYPDGVEPVSLMASKREVEFINSKRLEDLSGAKQSYVAFDEPGQSSRGFALGQREAKEVLDRNTRWSEVVDLKVGALVMLLVNMQDNILVNGSTGLISAFLTLPEALSQGIYIPDRALTGNISDKVLWPVIDFIPPLHAPISTQTQSRISGTGSRSQVTRKRHKVVRALIPQMSITVHNAQGGVEAIRHQVPISLAWGMTIHKAQGQSIDRLRVDLSSVFEHGQTYVALSRATNLDTLEIKGFSMDKVMAHPKVIEWSRPMEVKDEWDDLMDNPD